MVGKPSIKLPKAEDSYKEILQAFLDTFTHAVWIEDGDGTVLMNEQARQIDREGRSLSQASRQIPVGEERSVSVMGRKLRVQKKDMNHGTNCVLHEVKADEDAASRLRESTFRLKAVLSKP